MDNKRDVEELEDEIKEGMEFHFAENYFEVLDLVFGLKVEANKEWFFVLNKILVYTKSILYYFFKTKGIFHGF